MSRDYTANGSIRARRQEHRDERLRYGVEQRLNVTHTEGQNIGVYIDLALGWLGRLERTEQRSNLEHVLLIRDRQRVRG
jgi:hypothetical protein